MTHPFSIRGRPDEAAAARLRAVAGLGAVVGDAAPRHPAPLSLGAEDAFSFDACHDAAVARDETPWSAWGLPGSLHAADEASRPEAERDAPSEPSRWTYRRAWWAFLDSGRRGIAAVIVVAVLAAVVATVAFWRSRPAVVPIGGLSPRHVSALGAASAHVAAASQAAAGARPAPTTPSATASATVLVVDVAGKVRHPGLVRLMPGARVADALAAAGGPLPHARLGLLNLASPLSDGEQVVVGLDAPATTAESATSTGSAPTASGSGTGTSASAPVDVNTANAQQLDTLPRVGPVLAQRIIDFRTAHGLFRSVDELEQVPGIGPSTMADLRGLVTV